MKVEIKCSCEILTTRYKGDYTTLKNFQWGKEGGCRQCYDVGFHSELCTTCSPYSSNE